MTEVDRDIALALLKCLHKRGMLTDETYVSAVSSRFFDKRRFSEDPDSVHEMTVEEDGSRADN